MGQDKKDLILVSICLLMLLYRSFHMSRYAYRRRK